MKKAWTLLFACLVIVSGCGKQAKLPEGIRETPITVGKGTEYPLEGLLTTGKTPAKVAVVLVQGSGPSDKNETIYENTPFLDIAHGLALRGIDSIRYDKRTYAHGRKLSQIDMADFTIYDETIEDAIFAANLLKEKGYERIYLLGHSLGGMVALRTDLQSGGLFSGLILLAGSPRTLTEISIDQTVALIATIADPIERQKNQAVVDAEIEKLNKAPGMTAEERKATTLFGMPAPYIMDLNSVDTAELARQSKGPILVLQGSADFQVYAEKDYVLWQEYLANNPNAQFRLYDGLNHLFMPSGGDKQGTIEEYKTKGTVDSRVIADIADFILQ